MITEAIKPVRIHRFSVFHRIAYLLSQQANGATLDSILAPVAVARRLKIQCFRLAQNSKFPARTFSLVLDGDQKLFERNVLRGAAGGQGVAGAGEMAMLRGERNLHNPSTAILLPDLEAGELTLADRGENQAGPKKSHALKLHRSIPNPSFLR
jgi:hypothetical protein